MILADIRHTCLFLLRGYVFVWDGGADSFRY